MSRSVQYLRARIALLVMGITVICLAAYVVPPGLLLFLLIGVLLVVMAGLDTLQWTVTQVSVEWARALKNRQSEELVNLREGSEERETMAPAARRGKGATSVYSESEWNFILETGELADPDSFPRDITGEEAKSVNPTEP